MLHKLAVVGTIFAVFGTCEASPLAGATSNTTEHHSLTSDAPSITSLASNSSSHLGGSTISNRNATSSILSNGTATSEVVDDAAQTTSTSADTLSFQASQSSTSALSIMSKEASTTTSKDTSTSISTLATTKPANSASSTSDALPSSTSQPSTTFPSPTSIPSTPSTSSSKGQDFRTYPSRPTTTSPSQILQHNTTTLNFTCPASDIATSGRCADRFSCLYPHPEYCDSFIKCVVNPDGKTGTPQLFECPEGFGWDDGRKMCDPDVACDVATNSTLVEKKREERKRDGAEDAGVGSDDQTSQSVVANASLNLARAVREIFDGAVGD